MNKLLFIIPLIIYIAICQNETEDLLNESNKTEELAEANGTTEQKE